MEQRRPVRGSHRQRRVAGSRAHCVRREPRRRARALPTQEATGSNEPLLGSDASAGTRRSIQGVPLLVSPGVLPGMVWGIPKVRSIIVRRKNVELDVDKSAYFTSDRTAIRAVMRVTFAFPHAAAIQRIDLDI